MNLKFPRRLFAAALIASAPTALLLSAAPAAAIPVFDPANYAQNLLQAARSLEQINHQIQSLQNEATMIQNMAKNLQRIDFPEVQRMKSALDRVDRLIGEAKGHDLKVDGLDEKLRAMFPGAAGGLLSSDQRVANAKARLDAAMADLRRNMGVQAQVAANVSEDSELLDALVARSQGAEGALQVSQATNQLLALSTKQQLQLQSLMAAEYRSQALERARRDQAEAEGREATRRFLGTGRAYTPQ